MFKILKGIKDGVTPTKEKQDLRSKKHGNTTPPPLYIHASLKNIALNLKNGSNYRLDRAEERISELRSR